MEKEVIPTPHPTYGHLAEIMRRWRMLTWEQHQNFERLAPEQRVVAAEYTSPAAFPGYPQKSKQIQFSFYFWLQWVRENNYPASLAE